MFSQIYMNNKQAASTRLNYGAGKSFSTNRSPLRGSVSGIEYRFLQTGRSCGTHKMINNYGSTDRSPLRGSIPGIEYRFLQTGRSYGTH